MLTFYINDKLTLIYYTYVYLFLLDPLTDVNITSLEHFSVRFFRIHYNITIIYSFFFFPFYI